ncbi:MAG: protein translocase subunit SecF [bacterium]
MINYILFLLFIILTFALSFYTLKAEKEKLEIIKNSKKILAFIGSYWILFLAIILYSLITGKIKNILGIDFLGGTLTEVELYKTISDDKIIQIYRKYEVDPIIQNVILQDQRPDKRTIVIKTKPMEEVKKNQINKELEKLGGQIRRSENISSTIGKETLINALIALFIALAAQVVYIAIRFGNNILYGIIADIALVHDVTVMLGVYLLLGMMGFAGFEINSIFLAAVLTVIGYSVMDTIIIFDRIRENLKIEIKQNQKVSLEKFDQILNISVIQTLVRSVFTTFTLLLTLWGIVFLGGETLRSFAIALSVGTFSGAVSSILIAAPLVHLFKDKILSKDIRLITEEDKPKQVANIAENIMQIFAHQQAEEEISEKEPSQKQTSEISKSQKSIKDKYLKTRLVKKSKKDKN